MTWLLKTLEEEEMEGKQETRDADFTQGRGASGTFVKEEEMKPAYVLTFASADAMLENVGGKGASLSKMFNAGLPIPGGFHITTEAYRSFVAANDLQVRILAVLEQVDASSPASLETASETIHDLFLQGLTPPDVEQAIRGSYEGLGGPDKHVAVRSSATAEDLPEASFAGQQETYLNVSGAGAVREAVKKCWASLWTARAIAYRIKNHIDQGAVALAVVVQEMVRAEAAGILFTANPMNGRRDEMVINAAWGLGEAIVGGLVSPDTIVADKATGNVKKVQVAEKSVMTVTTDSGTEERPLNDARRRTQVLSRSDVAALVEVGRRIDDFYAQPQDIEWCRADGRFHIVQSRPITALPEPELPAPTAWKLPKGAYAAMRNNIVELMADPLSPLFATLGLSAVNSSLNRFMDESFAMRGIMPADIVMVVNHYAYNNGSVSARSIARLLFGAGTIMKKMFSGAVERWTEAGRPQYLQIVQEWQAKDWRSFSSLQLLETAKLLTGTAIDAYGAMISGLIPAAWITEAMFTKLYNALIKRRDDPAAPTYLLGYDSLPIRADQSLYSLAAWARKEPSLVEYLERTPTAELAAMLKEKGSAPAALDEWRRRLHQHLQQFGGTLYDLDFAHPLPADDPSPVLETFRLYLGGQGVNPYTRQSESEERREQAVHSMQQRLKGVRLQWFNKYLARAQRYAPLREDGLAEIGLAYPLIRGMLHLAGERFAEQEVIPAADDIFWLTEEEARAAAARLDAGLPAESFSENIRLRKAEHRAALSAKPPMALPQMMVFGFDLMSLKDKRGRAGKGNVIKGVAASPGRASGLARVLHGPEDFDQMKPGDVLVAPITTPAWTPLFAMASAIVTDVGGPLSHGSIVAREYGIPAVLGTGVATRRIHSGQKVMVDGSSGKVELI
jgi:pyruvate,water dikinase